MVRVLLLCVSKMARSLSSEIEDHKHCKSLGNLHYYFRKEYLARVRQLYLGTFIWYGSLIGMIEVFSESLN